MKKVLILAVSVLSLCSCKSYEYKDWSANAPLDAITIKAPEGETIQKGMTLSVYSMSELGNYNATYQAQQTGATVSFKPFAYSSVAQKAEKFYVCSPAGYIDFEIGGGEIPEIITDEFIPMGGMSVTEGEISNPYTIQLGYACSKVKIDIEVSETTTLNNIVLSSNALLSGKGKFTTKNKTPYLRLTTGKYSITRQFKNTLLEEGKTYTFFMPLPANVSLTTLSVKAETEAITLSKSLGAFSTDMGKVVEVKLSNPKIYNAKIYESDTYTSFADLVYYKGTYYCAFRDGANHVPTRKEEPNGIIRILQSKDCRTWTNAGTITDSRYDLRDPHFCISPKTDSLLIFFAYHEVDNSWVQPSKTVVSVLEPAGNTITEKRRSNCDAGPVYSRYWIWNITVSDNKIYGVAYYENGKNVAFLTSDDGEKWSFISEIPYLGNEASVNIINGKAYVLMRNQTGEKNSSMAVASAPFTSWTVTPMNYGLHSPAGVEYNGKLYICGRKYENGTRDGVSLFSYTLPNSTSLKEEYRLPCDKYTGDNAYPGVIIQDGKLRIAYYAIQMYYNVPDIYYTEIPLELLGTKLQ